MTRLNFHTWFVAAGVALVLALVGTSLLFNLGRDRGYQAGLEAAAEASPDCPPYPGAEQHPVEDWVCETEEDWGKLLMDCNEESSAAHTLMEIVGTQERELEWWQRRCTPRNDEKMEQIRRDTEKAVLNLAAQRAIERKNEEDEQK